MYVTLSSRELNARSHLIFQFRKLMKIEFNIVLIKHRCLLRDFFTSGLSKFSALLIISHLINPWRMKIDSWTRWNWIKGLNLVWLSWSYLSVTQFSSIWTAKQYRASNQQNNQVACLISRGHEVFCRAVSIMHRILGQGL